MGEKLTGFKILGITISFFGVVMIVSKGYSFNFFSSDTVVGDLLMLFDGFLWAVYTVVGKDLLKKYSSDVLTAYAFVFGSILLFPFAVYEGTINPLSLSLMSWISILYLGVLCSVVAYVIWYSALKVMGATDVAVFVYIVPLFTAIMALFVLNEEIGIFTAVGGIMTMLGVYITERY
jgi:drug/metabolite transporter (DMT)-like permease